MILEIKYEHLLPLVKVLDAINLSVRESRYRTRFKNMVAKHGEEIMLPEMKLIIKEYAVLDDKNEIVYADEETGRPLFDNSLEEEKCSEAIKELNSEIYPIRLDEYNKTMILSVANSLLNAENIKVNGDLADALDEWCEQFENAIEFYNSEEKKEKKKKKNK